MRPLVTDTSVLLPGLLAPKGQRRKLLVLCAYGALNYFTRVGLDELELVREQAEHAGAELGGLPIEKLIEQAEYRRAALAEQLPALAPDDLLLVGSPALFNELEAKLVARGPKMLKDRWQDDMAERYLRILISICGIFAPPFDLAAIPEHTQGRDRDDDLVIETAFQGGAVAIVTDDKGIALEDDDGVTTYTDPRMGAGVLAYWPGVFVERVVNTSGFDLNDVDGSLLELAVSRA
jgi:predicted nucleic acid-binding protein